ncbi:GDP-mannose-dependent alpha-mannosyltransferase [Pseudovibrio axinellae]|uniref:GDP-mannose-dependent alpha-mannosyltransferase n=1 Tax=Pseudovibrio axinellae TaxID=989403 RepID=A0A166APN9_9HYPH|nr:glycosyltransferase family 1 protein [Pseudovibrio axinellae]KZL21392.1 GDP-mannose-dependent alpha-mannosyltransferase [Pseudovibrio axinellae]SEQ98495.1 Glycosyltransferase involved in cell wall bisynthesis [Pseudovibrio axinellae]
MNSILIVTDAWKPQINGVVRTLERLAIELRQMGLRVELLTPQSFHSVPMPSYGEIRLSLTLPHLVRDAIEKNNCDFLHVATEGPLGLMARRVAKRDGRAFTTSYHTRFPEYLRARYPVPLSLTYDWLKRFHNSGQGCMVATRTLEEDLRKRGFSNLLRWSRGVDHNRFRPIHSDRLAHLPGPRFLYVGRVAVEKNIEAFLRLSLPGTKVVVGGGPQLDELRKTYPDVVFTGPKEGEELVEYYSGADVFVFPSLTETFGNVLLEAIACGRPVAAFPVMGPIDVIGSSGAGVLKDDLQEAALEALDISREHCREVALQFTWRASAEQFFANASQACNPTVPVGSEKAARFGKGLSKVA